MALDQQITPEMVLKQMGEIVQNTKSDLFRVRVSRRDNPQALVPKVIATLEGATLDHLQSPETWLSQLAGGGHFFLQAVHKSNPTAPFAPLQVVMAGDMRAPDPYADTRPTWRGPAEIVIPEKQRTQNDDQGSFTPLLVGPTGSMGTPPRNGAPQGSGPVGSTSPPVPADPNVMERFRLQQAQDELLRRERIAAEERHRQELDLNKRANELEIAKLRAEMAASRQPQGESAIDKMLMMMREEAKQREEREETRRREERDREERRLEAERAREERRLAMEREDRKEREAERQRLEERLAAERKAADDRFLQLMNERQNSGVEMMKMMAPVSEMMGTSMNVVVQALHSIAELNQPGGEQEPPYFKLVGKIVDGIKAAAEAAKMNARVRMPSNPVRRPIPPRPPPLAQPPAPPSPPPPSAPAAAAPPAPPAQAFNGLEPTASPPPPPPPPTPIRKPTAFEVLISMIKAKEDPEKVARFFYANIKARSIAVELTAHDMQIVPTFAPHLLPWLKDNESNQAYMSTVFTKVQEIGREMGIVEPVDDAEGEEEAGEEGEDDGAEGEEEEDAEEDNGEDDGDEPADEKEDLE